MGLRHLDRQHWNPASFCRPVRLDSYSLNILTWILGMSDGVLPSEGGSSVWNLFIYIDCSIYCGGYVPPAVPKIPSWEILNLQILLRVFNFHIKDNGRMEYHDVELLLTRRCLPRMWTDAYGVTQFKYNLCICKWRNILPSTIKQLNISLFYFPNFYTN